jgi:hypothetical protein
MAAMRLLAHLGTCALTAEAVTVARHHQQIADVLLAVAKKTLSARALLLSSLSASSSSSSSSSATSLANHLSHLTRVSAAVLAALCELSLRHADIAQQLVLGAVAADQTSAGGLNVAPATSAIGVLVELLLGDAVHAGTQQIF